MKVIFRVHEGRFYPSYVLTILFLFKIEIATKEVVTGKKLGMDFTENETILNNLIGFSSAFYNVTSSYTSKVFYYGYILFFLSRYKKPIGNIEYIFDREDVRDYDRKLLTKDQLLVVSKVDENGN